jgi:hypothetical protein
MTYAYILIVGNGPNQRILGVFCDDGDAHTAFQVWSDLTKCYDEHHVIQVPYGVVTGDRWPEFKVMPNRDVAEVPSA